MLIGAIALFYGLFLFATMGLSLSELGCSLNLLITAIPVLLFWLGLGTALAGVRLLGLHVHVPFFPTRKTVFYWIMALMLLLFAMFFLHPPCPCPSR
jgi:hypothetical protein